jgi:integrase
MWACFSLALPPLGHKRLSDVRRADVQELADRLTAEELSASTVQNTLDPLRAIYRRALRRDEGVTINPTKGLELRRPDGKRERIATPAEAAALIAAVSEGERALWACAFYAGLRRGELRALRWSHVDLDARVIHVSSGWDAIEGEQDTKSAAGKRRVPILDPLATELTAHKTLVANSWQSPPETAGFNRTQSDRPTGENRVLEPDLAPPLVIRPGLPTVRVPVPEL